MVNIPEETVETKEEFLIEEVVETKEEEVIEAKVIDFDNVVIEHHLNTIQKATDKLYNSIVQLEEVHCSMCEYEILIAQQDEAGGNDGFIIKMIADKADNLIKQMYNDYGVVYNTLKQLLNKKAAAGGNRTAT